MLAIGGTLVGYFKQGGPVMWPLLILSIIGLIVILERGFTLYVRARTKTAEMVGKVRRLVSEGKTDAALKACDEYKGPTSAMVKAAILRWDASREELEKLLENAALHEIARLERWLWVLALISNIAPIIGFLGTVVGMIQSFDVIAREGLNNPGKVAKGISVALITTAGGLIVAVFTLPFYNFYTTKIAGYIRELETTANIILETHDQVKA
ncbi:MAG: MotA/TolQ/ExbB proton channel family protein [Acidobacteriota bacterium]|nr:MotA/TolQ/ExbB proton channel family protein [Acidobacteriota bacterium]MDQ7087641.1 MotA/TolQ/ExbB proton channel family protein [Acidobacteriota bacterium]